jgi:Icc protein
MLLAQISDMHLVPPGRRLLDRIDTAGCLGRAVTHLNRLSPRPDFLLATGDLTDDGSAASYQLLRRTLDALAMPYAVMPGNHDNRGHLRKTFGDRTPFLPDDEFLHYVLDDLPLRIIALDTVVPGNEGGTLCAGRLAWLADRLAEQADKPTMIAMHHPPFISGIDDMDAINCRNSSELGAIVLRHPQVERIVCGHIHRPITVRWNGTVVTTAPSTAHQVALNLTPGASVRWIAEPPACYIHYWESETGLVTHLSYIGDFGGPQTFC